MFVCYLGWRYVKFHKYNSVFPVFIRKRLFSSYKRPSPPVNHYQVLGLTPKSTQAEVKASFYKLSKIFHPDVSDQSEDSAIKFRQITAAYEILGNLKLRKMYDRGLLPSDGTVSQDVDVEYQEAKVNTPYKKTRSQPATGRTTVYDFDQWSRLHYGTTLNRRAAAKEKWESLGVDLKVEKEHQKSDNFVAVILLTVLIMSGLHVMGSSDFDVPIVVENKKKP